MRKQEEILANNFGERSLQNRREVFRMLCEQIEDLWAANFVFRRQERLHFDFRTTLPELRGEFFQCSNKS